MASAEADNMRAVPIQRINVFWFLTLGVTSLAAGLLVYLLLLESALGAFRIREASPANLGDRVNPTIGILESAESRIAFDRLFPSGIGMDRYDETVSAWKEVLSERHLDAIVELTDDNLSMSLSGGGRSITRLSGPEHDVLILPAAIAIGDVQLRQIEELLDSGGSLLISWSAGIYTDEQRWRGWDFLEEKLGFAFQEYVESGRGDYRIAVDTVASLSMEGVYVPRAVYDDLEKERVASMSIRQTEELKRTQRQASENNVPTLQDYVWYDTLRVENPRNDFLSVQHYVPDPDRPDHITGSIITYLTWVGDSEPIGVPYPRTAGTTKRFSLRGNTPLTAGIPGGYRAKVQVYHPGVNVQITDPSRVHSAGFWHDFATDPPSIPNVLEPMSGLVYGTYKNGRFVFMGFGPEALSASKGDPEDEEVWARLYDNVLDYLQRKPIAWTHDWPLGHTAAAMIFSDVTASSTHFGAMADFIDRENISASVFVDELFALENREAVARVYSLGDVGVFDPQETLLTGTVQARRNRLERLRQSLTDVVGGPVSGYRSRRPGGFAHNTKAALALEGYLYIVPDSIGRRTSPKIMGSPYESLTRIGVTTREVEHKNLWTGSVPAGKIDSLLLADAYRVLDEGGVFRMNLPPEAFASVENIEILRRLIQRLRREKLWIAAGDDIANWWRLRNGLNIAVEQRSPSRIFVRLSNDNGDTAEEATVSILLGEKVSSVKIRPELINILKPADDEINNPPFELLENGSVLQLKIRQLKPQQYRIFHIDLNTPNGPVGFANN